MFVKENLFTTLKSNKEGTDAFYSESSLSHGWCNTSPLYLTCPVQSYSEASRPNGMNSFPFQGYSLRFWRDWG